MFRLVRLSFLLALSFLTGILWERLSMAERCIARGGDPRGAICMEIRQ